jgi:predicted Zn-dependent protease
MKGSIIICGIVLLLQPILFAQQNANSREYLKVFPTYPFSDPDPVPEMGKFYPYYRFDGYTDKPINKEWKVVELENEYITVIILPEIGGKIWAAIEKSTGKSFLYYNHVVKFRDVAMRGPWTSGGIEPNYGIIGHTPNCATPVDYVVINKPDGSVSCVVGVLDLLTRTTWRIDVNLQKDKAYFTTSSFWYNASPFEQPYYTWMNTGIKAKGNLQFIYPGTKYLGHSGEYSDWPINKENGKDISFYENNNFGGYKSYHVFGKYTDFFGGYWHDEDFGMGRYSTHDEKAGKKIWIWGLSQQGMIWENLLTDTDGQYVEVQSGRLFNQAAEGSSFTPFKNREFLPYATDVWTEYWFPVVKTKGFVAANNFGALNIKKENGFIKIYFSPLQNIKDELKITDGSKIVYSKSLSLKPLQLFTDSVAITTSGDALLATLGTNKLEYNASPSANVLARPVESPKDFNWKSAYGLYLQGKEWLRQRKYPEAEEKLKACLGMDHNYLPALADMSMLMYRNMRYAEALNYAKKALSVSTYDPAANYYYGLINSKLGNIADAKDGFDIASMSMEYRNAAYTSLARLYFKENNFEKAIQYARKSIDFNNYAIDAYQLLAVIFRLKSVNKFEPASTVNTILRYDQLNHFSKFEKYLKQNSATNKEDFIGLIRNEMPYETFLELAIWYNNIGRKEDAAKVLQLSPPNAEVMYWQAFLENKPLNVNNLNPEMVFPFRPETAEILEHLIAQYDHWLLKYNLALIHWSCNNIDRAAELFTQCGTQSTYAPFYAARAKFFMEKDSAGAFRDLQQAVLLDKNQWRYGRNLINYYINHKQPEKALSVAEQYTKQFPSNYLISMLYARTLLLNKQYNSADVLLRKIKILPNEGATGGRQLYKEVQLMLALEEIKKKNYKKALGYITAARQWPENLGVGKPYDSDIDERLEDWLSYEIYSKQGNKEAAAKMLDKIITYTASLTAKGNISPSINNLVSAWALEKTGKSEQAEKILQQSLDNYPDNLLGQWVMNVYKGKDFKLIDETITNENYRILQAWITSSIQK